MRWTTSLIPTLREDPADAEAISHKLMVRAGLVRQLAAGIYVYLPLGQRVIDKVNAIIREEMNGIGGQEITMPVLHPAEIWQQSGRWDDIKDEMFRLKDRNGRDMCLGMTHEEVIAWLAASEIRSYRELPQIWYQIQTKERDEARPRSGVLRTREFLMKDSYTLDPDDAGLDISYDKHKDAYRRIFDRCGVAFHVVESDSGMMGGSGAHEFMAPSAAGEDEVALCPACGYAANVELARVEAAAGGAAVDAPPRRGRDPGRAHHRRGVRLLRIEPAAHDQDPGLRRAGRAGARAGPGRPALHERKLARLRAARCARRIPRRSASPRRAGRVGRPGGRRRCRSSPTRRSGRGRTWPAPTGRASTSAVSSRAGTSRRGTPISRWPWPGDACPTCGKPLRGRAGDRGRQHLQARDAVLGDARRDVPRRAGPAASDRHGLATASAPPASSRRRSSSATTRTASSGPGRSRRSRCSCSPVNPKQPAVRGDGRAALSRAWARLGSR